MVPDAAARGLLMTILRATGTDLDVQESGQGRDVLLLHSLLTNRGSFARVVPTLGKSRRVLLAALPGFDRSTAAGPTIEDYADRIAAFLPALSRGKPDVIANGFGGVIAVALAARHGDRIGCLVLCDTTATFPEAGRVPFRNMAAAVEKAGMSAIVDTAVKRIFSPDYLLRHPEAVDERRAVLLRADPRHFAAACRALATVDLRPALPKIANPALVVVGTLDSATPPELPATSPKASRGRRCGRFPIAGTARPCKNPRSSSRRSATFSSFDTEAIMSMDAIKNYVGGGWTAPASRDDLPVVNPATAEVIAKVPLSSKSDIDRAAAAAAEALPGWRRTPPGDRIQPLFKLKQLIEENIDELARTITDECGKTRDESIGELRRGIENVEVACGIPMMLQGQYSEDIASGIDELMIRQPVGVVGIITPFNFPGMIPMWFLPYAIACGNTLVLKPSEKVPLTMQKIFQLLERTGLPKGVANLVNGSKETVEALVDHPAVRAISLVGSTPVARSVYARAAANGKRAQCQGGAKNPVIVLPDADMETATRIVADSAFGCAGQRCL